MNEIRISVFGGSFLKVDTATFGNLLRLRPLNTRFSYSVFTIH